MRGIGVAPSPLNKVKFELGVVLVALPLLWLVVERLVDGWVAQLALLLVAGCTAAVWLVLRTRSVLRRLELEQRGVESGAQQE
ncbi:MAG TPA: hypothetical protein ENJ43_07990 [Gammaproteobacteria bacterium]|nr:hypothetical protein [Gammaproteobacteria bacterium]